MKKRREETSYRESGDVRDGEIETPERKDKIPRDRRREMGGNLHEGDKNIRKERTGEV